MFLGGDYPLEGYYDKSGKLVTDYVNHLKFIDAPYLHLTNLPRSTNQQTKVISREQKYEIGIPFAKDYKYPEVFYTPRPDIVPDPWVKMTSNVMLRSLIETPLKKIKRRITNR
jgi:hypothetical protein